MTNINLSYLIPCTRPEIGPNGEGQNVPPIRLAFEAGLTLVGAACLFKGRRLLGGALMTLGAATALGEVRVIRSLHSTPSAPPPPAHKAPPLPPYLLAKEYELSSHFRLPVGTATISQTSEDTFEVNWIKDQDKFGSCSLWLRPDGEVSPRNWSDNLYEADAKTVFSNYDAFINDLQERAGVEFKWIIPEKMQSLRDEITPYLCTTKPQETYELWTRLEDAEEGSYCIAPWTDSSEGSNRYLVATMGPNDQLELFFVVVSPFGFYRMSPPSDQNSEWKDKEWASFPELLDYFKLTKLVK